LNGFYLLILACITCVCIKSVFIVHWCQFDDSSSILFLHVLIILLNCKTIGWYHLNTASIAKVQAMQVFPLARSITVFPISMSALDVDPIGYSQVTPCHFLMLESKISMLLHFKICSLTKLAVNLNSMHHSILLLLVLSCTRHMVAIPFFRSSNDHLIPFFRSFYGP